MKAFCALVLFLAAAGTRAAEPVLIDGVAARVNNHTITVSDVLGTLRAHQEELRARYSGDELKAKLHKAFDEAREALVERFLILDVYEKQDAKLPDWVVENRMEEIIRDMFNGDRGKLMQALAGDQITMEEWRRQTKEYIVVASMRRENIEQRTAVSPALTRQHYEQHRERFVSPARERQRRIIVPRGATPEEQTAARMKIEDIRQRLLAGEDFATLAAASSAGTRASSGGDWGWVDPGELRPEFAQATASLKPGEVSAVIATEDEYYLIKVEERTAAKPVAYEDALPQIERDLRRESADRLYAEWIARLRQKAYVSLTDVNPFS